MSARWHALFIPLEDVDRVESALRATLAALGYQPYDPFPGGSGTPPGLADLARSFVAPPGEGWTRVVGEVDPAALPALSVALDVPLLEGWLAGGEDGFAVWQAGARDGSADALAAFLRSDRSRADLDAALHATSDAPDAPSEGPTLVDLGAGALPPEIEQLAEQHGVDARQADKLVKRLSGNLFGKLNRQAGGSESDAQAQARVMLAGQADVWATPAGRRVTAIAAALRLPANWRAPDFDAVREAYQLRRLRARSPRLPLMPGDQQALDTVPDALDYRPVYMGRTSG